MNIAIIPARGGSKRIPRKNIKLFSSKPMLAYAINAAKSSGLFSHVIVSTDDEEIREVALKWGAETPFLRPRALSDDYTPTVPVVSHAILSCENMGWNFNNVCCIYPGVPFIQADDLKLALNLLEASKADYCFPITEYTSMIQRALKRNAVGELIPMYPEYELSRTQDLERTYHDAGQFYWGSKQAWLTNSRIHSSSVGLIIPNWRVVDIDNLEDWKRAELIYRSLYINCIE